MNREAVEVREVSPGYRFSVDKPAVPAGYKQTEVGVIPQDWKLVPFSDIFEFRNGVNADKSSYGQGIRFINVLEPITYSHIYGPEITGKVTLPETLAVPYTVRPGDILFNRTSETPEELGLASAYLGVERVVFGGFVIRGRPNGEKLDAVYAGYALRAQYVRKQIIPMGQGAIRTNIGQKNLSLVVTPVPPLSEQRAIATALSDVDALLEELDRMIAKKRDIKQATMQQLLTGQTRLPGFEGEWEKVRAGDIGRFRGGSGFPTRFQGVSSGAYPFFKVSDMNNEGNSIFMESANHCISEPVRKQIGAVVFPSGAIVFAKVGAAVFLERKKILTKLSCIDNNMAGYIVNTEKVDVRFIHYVLLSKALGDLVSTTALPSLNGSVLAAMEFHLPQLEEQIAIARALADIDVELEALEQRRAKTADLKQAMMQELLAGRTRLV